MALGQHRIRDRAHRNVLQSRLVTAVATETKQNKSQFLRGSLTWYVLYSNGLHAELCASDLGWAECAKPYAPAFSFIASMNAA